MIDKADNYTRYNTEDLNLILQAIGDLRFEYKTYGERIRIAAVNVPRGLRVGPLYGEKGGLSRLGPSWLRVRTPPGLIEHLELGGLELLGFLSSEPSLAPTDLVFSIVIDFAMGMSSYAYRNYATQAVEAAREIASKHRLRVMDRLEATPDRTPLTPEQKLERLQSDSFYGPGGELEGPDWAWRSGSRCPTGKWEYRITAAQEYYERELAARNKYIRQIEDLGGEVVPYETFAQYLRRMADEMEGVK